MGKEKIINLLNKRGIKLTIQRIEILSYLIEHKTHPSVDEIYTFLSSKIPTLSKATIYNTLKLFCKKKILNEILIEGDEVHFDYIEKPHFHFKCKICKKIYDIYKECPIINLKEIDSHIIEEYHIYLMGICKNCISKTKNV